MHVQQRVCRQANSRFRGALLRRENLKLETLAELFNYNSGYLGKMFKSFTGDTFHNLFGQSPNPERQAFAGRRAQGAPGSDACRVCQRRLFPFEIQKVSRRIAVPL